jgi:hypothetical protein
MEILTAVKRSVSSAATAPELLIRRAKVAFDFQRARSRFLKATGPVTVETAAHHLREVPLLTAEEKRLLRSVSPNVDPFDTMYAPGKAGHYLLVGISAIRCIEAVLENTSLRADEIRSILDFPVGYGRVLRFLRAKFPQARISGAELDASAMSFCMREFSIEPVKTLQDFSQISTPGRFDLIWCGSLLTHINEDSAIALLRFFRDHLTENGVCLVSMHGHTSAEWVRQKKHTYGLALVEQQELLQQYEQSGYGYVDYSNVLGYGISIASPERMKTIICQLGKCIFFQAAAWDHHHDVYGFQR